MIRLKNLLTENPTNPNANPKLSYVTDRTFKLGKSGGDITLKQNNYFGKPTGVDYQAVCYNPIVEWFGESAGFTDSSGSTFKPEGSAVLRLEYRCSAIKHKLQQTKYYKDAAKLHLIVKLPKHEWEGEGFKNVAFPVYNNKLEKALFTVFCGMYGK